MTRHQPVSNNKVVMLDRWANMISMTHRYYAMSFLFIAEREIIMKFLAIKTCDGEFIICNQKSKRKKINKALKAIKLFLSQRDCEVEISLDDLDPTTSVYDMYSRLAK